MSSRTGTICFLLIWIVCAVLYDWWAYRRAGPEATISRVIQDWVQWCPFLAVALGCLLWHLTGGRAK
jgi:hypothetical protein